MCKLLVEKHKNMSDNELIKLVQQNDEQAFNVIFKRYLPFIKSVVYKHSKSFNDFDDLMQEATISFYFASVLYDFNSSSFKTFASLCIEREIVSTFKKALAKKRIPLNLIDNIDEKEIVSGAESPEQLIIKKEEDTNFLIGIKKKLSKLESLVIDSYIQTGSYDETAKLLSITRKSVDNALSRIRKKISHS